MDFDQVAKTIFAHRLGNGEHRPWRSVAHTHDWMFGAAWAFDVSCCCVLEIRKGFTMLRFVRRECVQVSLEGSAMVLQRY